MNRKFLIILFITAIILLASCGGSKTLQSSIPAQSNSVDSSVSTSVLNESKISELSENKNNTESSKSSVNEVIYPDNRKILYHFIIESELYDVSKLLEVKDDADYGDIFNYVVDEVFPNEEIPAVHSLTLRKGHVICNLDKEWIENFNKGQLYEFCNTLAMTLQKNGFCESIGFRINGEVGLLGGEVWKTAELKVLEIASADEFTKIRETIPYTGLRSNGGNSYFYFAESLKKDDMAEKIHRVLRMAGELTNEFDHPSEIDMEHVVQNLIWCTEPVDIDPNSEDYNVKIAQNIMPIAASVSQRLAAQENWFWLKEHIEESAYRIFGDDVVIKHREPLMPYKWFESEGVYTPPHMGGRWNIIPHLYKYSVEDETVIAEVAYLRETMQGFYDAVQDKFMDNYDDVEEYLENRAQRHIVTLRTEAGGRLTVRQHHLSDLGGN